MSFGEWANHTPLMTFLDGTGGPRSSDVVLGRCGWSGWVGWSGVGGRVCSGFSRHAQVKVGVRVSWRPATKATNSLAISAGIQALQHLLRDATLWSVSDKAYCVKSDLRRSARAVALVLWPISRPPWPGRSAEGRVPRSNCRNEEFADRLPARGAECINVDGHESQRICDVRRGALRVQKRISSLTVLLKHRPHTKTGRSLRPLPAPRLSFLAESPVCCELVAACCALEAWAPGRHRARKEA